MSESFRPNHNSILYPFPLSLETERGSVKILSLRSGVIHGFCDRALTLLLCPVFMWVRSFKYARAVRSLVLFRVGAWCSDPGTLVLSFSFVSGFRHSRSMFCLILGACSLEFALPHALPSTCVVACSSCFIGCVHSCYVLWCVARSLCF